MPRYFFDTRDNDRFIRDDEGAEFDSFQEVKKQAAVSLTALARDAQRGNIERKLGVEVSDDWRRPALKAVLTVEPLILGFVE